MSATIDQIIVLNDTSDDSRGPSPEVLFDSDGDPITTGSASMSEVELETNDSDEEDAHFHVATRGRLRRYSERMTILHDCALSVDALRQRNHVLSVLCGFATDDAVMGSARRIQAHIRGYILRKDKAQFERCVRFFLARCRGRLARMRVKRRLAACTRIQAVARGGACRRSRIGRCVARVCDMRTNIVDLELLVLRLTSMGVQTILSSTLVVR